MKEPILRSSSFLSLTTQAGFAVCQRMPLNFWPQPLGSAQWNYRCTPPYQFVPGLKPRASYTPAKHSSNLAHLSPVPVFHPHLPQKQRAVWVAQAGLRGTLCSLDPLGLTGILRSSCRLPHMASRAFKAEKGKEESFCLGQPCPVGKREACTVWVSHSAPPAPRPS